MNKAIRKVLSLVMAFALVFALGATPATAYAYDVVTDVRTIYDIPADLTGKTVILHTNDVHGAIGRYAYVASVKQNLQKRGADVILVDAGDFSQGTPYASTTKGLDVISVMNAAGYDIVTLGNHEFDYGYTQLMANLSTAKFKAICADVYDANGNTILPPNTIYTTKTGMKIGFFGLETPEAKTKANPKLIEGLNFLSKSDLYTCAQTQADALKAQGSDIVICLAHLGVDDESAPDGHRSVDLYGKTKGIDILLDGHSHTVMVAGANNEPIASTGTKIENIGVVVIDDAAKKIEDHYLISSEGLQKEVITDAVATAIIKRVDREYGKVFAKSEVRVNGDRNPGNRTEETTMGNLATDAMFWSIKNSQGSLSVDDDHIVVVMNGGGIRSSIEAGSITRNDLNTAFPFGHTVAVAYITGADLLEALEASTYCTPMEIGGYPQTKGIKLTLDTTKSFDRGTAYPESTYYKPASVRRVTIESINGEPFSMTDTYAVITNNFCAAGGDTYYAFRNASSQFDTGISLEEAVMNYIKTELKGTIPASKYGTPRGNQTIIK